MDQAVNRVSPFRRRRAGGSLLEVLVGMAILGLVMLGILQVFSISLLQSQGSATRTQLTYKCQQVVEVMRVAQFIARQDPAAYATSSWAASGLTFPLAASADTPLPYTGSETGYAFWGPSGANIIERPNDSFMLFYTVENAGTAGMRVRVTAYPSDAPNLPSTAPAATPTRRNMGAGSKLKVVEYVAQIPNA